jgi:hypothetical protein
MKFVYGEWKGDRAAGSLEEKRPRSGNPQYLITVTQPDDDDEEGECSVVIGLMQMFRRKNITSMVEFLPINYCIYSAVSEKKKLLLESSLYDVAFLDYGSRRYQPITYYWTVPLILDHSYLVGRLTSSKIADTKVSGF